MDKINLTDDQARYIQAIFDHLEYHGDWSTFNDIDRHLYRSVGVDAKEIALSLAQLVFGSGYMPWSQPDVKLILPLRVVTQCTGTALKVRMELVVATVKLAVQTELRSDSPKITSQQLKDGWKIPDPDLLRLGRLLAAEPSVWSGTFSGPDAPGVWSMGVGRDIRRFRDVNSVDELVAALPPLPTMPIFSKPNPTIQ